MLVSIDVVARQHVMSRVDRESQRKLSRAASTSDSPTPMPRSRHVHPVHLRIMSQQAIETDASSSSYCTFLETLQPPIIRAQTHPRPEAHPSESRPLRAERPRPQLPRPVEEQLAHTRASRASRRETEGLVRPAQEEQCTGQRDPAAGWHG